MKISYVEVFGFRGYRKPVRLTFGERFTIIDGRNGTGKSTVFDAIEFALTGKVSKYKEMKADGETVADYIWWTGDGFGPLDRYVEVGFVDEDSTIIVRRTHLADPDTRTMESLIGGLCDARTAPNEPLTQLCEATIIRDEHITSLSLDLKEVDRYALLRNALGANDSEEWISRAAQLTAAANQRLKVAETAVTTANSDSTAAIRRLDELRSSLAEESVLSSAVTRLQVFARSSQPADELAGPVRQRLADANAEIVLLRQIADRAKSIEALRLSLTEQRSVVDRAVEAESAARTAFTEFEIANKQPSELSAAAVARSIIQLIALGRSVGLQEGNCPLCASPQSGSAFAEGLAAAEVVARKLDAEAARLAEIGQRRVLAASNLQAATTTLAAAQAQFEADRSAVESFDANLVRLNIGGVAAETNAGKRADTLQRSVEAAQGDLRILETLRQSSLLEAAHAAVTSAAARAAGAQEAYGRAHKAQTIAHALHDATRRAAAETLEQRLERVLPLMAELYRRLRPHPVWHDIEYSIRGDVKRFLKLKVGDDLNPQFLFSSGQRRATGIAFLLSVNLSLAWSRWRSILLDDPVQHVDDFRAVHLAEVTAQLAANGRQIICAVEDAALADLLCRRLPIEKTGDGKRITLGSDSEGALAKLVDQDLQPFPRYAVFDETEMRAAV